MQWFKKQFLKMCWSQATLRMFIGAVVFVGALVSGPLVRSQDQAAAEIRQSLATLLYDKAGFEQHRMAVVQLASVGASAVPHVSKLLNHSEQRMRLLGLEVLKQLGEEALPALSQLRPLLQHSDAKMRAGGLRVIHAIGPGAGEVIVDVLALVADQDEVTRGWAMRAALRIAPNYLSEQLLEEMARRGIVFEDVAHSSIHQFLGSSIRASEDPAKRAELKRVWQIAKANQQHKIRVLSLLNQ
ncbi:MAG: hypothetical protein MK165_01275 [Pirellulaceae bacterium]|nr:hypothetical protein [Pirellulaceae bacterium]